MFTLGVGKLKSAILVGAVFTLGVGKLQFGGCDESQDYSICLCFTWALLLMSLCYLGRYYCSMGVWFVQLVCLGVFGLPLVCFGGTPRLFWDEKTFGSVSLLGRLRFVVVCSRLV